MERECKNCGHMLYVGHTHCASCGAKWIQNRITMRNVASDFSDMYLGLDTKFVHTFVDLFKHPGEVINGYINGRRAYYMDAIRYMLLALLVSGIYTYVMRHTGFFEVYMEEMRSISPASGSEEAQKMAVELQNKMVNFLFDFQGLVYFLTIPALAICARIVFWGKNYYNFTEHIVFYLYTYGHIIIVTTPITILLMFVSMDAYSVWSIGMFPAMFAYNAYCYKRCFDIDWQEIILKSLIGVIVMIIVFVLLAIIAFLVGVAGVILAKKMNWV